VTASAKHFALQLITTRHRRIHWPEASLTCMPQHACGQRANNFNTMLYDYKLIYADIGNRVWHL